MRANYYIKQVQCSSFVISSYSLRWNNPHTQNNLFTGPCNFSFGFVFVPIFIFMLLIYHFSFFKYQLTKNNYKTQ